MKSFKFKLTISILIIFSFITITNYFDNIYKNNPIYAANEKVTTIERSYDYKDNKIKEIYSGKTASGKKGFLRCDRSYRTDCFYLHSGNCLRLDGCALHLYLPTGRRSCRNHVLLDLRKILCGNTGKQRKKETFYHSLSPCLQIYLLPGMCTGTDTGNFTWRNWMIL